MRKITHEEAIQILKTPVIVGYMRDKLFNYIIQQEKKDELLELYRKRDKTLGDDWAEQSDTYNDLNLQIQELESELKWN